MSKSLLERNTRYLLIWLPIVLFLCSILFYFVLQMHAEHMQRKQLLLKQSNIWNAFVSHPENFPKHITGEYDIVESADQPAFTFNIPRDTSVNYIQNSVAMPFQILTGQKQIGNKIYLITTYVSSTEISHLIVKVFLSEAIILALLLIAIVVLNRKSARLLWQPFLSTMKKLDEYDIARNPSLTIGTETGTAEFNQLNQELQKLIHNVNAAYHNQKQFVENASHEMQTPLAIIRSKLELLINQPTLTEHNASLLGDITEANDRLSQMNRTLLLLSKIENNQFPHTEKVNISEALELLLTNFKNHYDDFPELDASIEKNIVITANRPLIDILLSNLLNNSIIHNIPQGKIEISLSENQFIIKNTGSAPTSDPIQLFERFKKGSHQTKTTGLGLALVKQICSLYHYSISYHFTEGWHSLELTFR